MTEFRKVNFNVKFSRLYFYKMQKKPDSELQSGISHTVVGRNIGKF